MAKRAGWPAEQLSALQEERKRLTEAAGWPVMAQPYACDAVRAVQVYGARIGQLGELGALRQRVAEQAAERAAVSPAASVPQRLMR